MAKEKKAAEHEKHGEGGKKRLHLHEIRTTAAHDGTYTHHHTYKDHADAAYSHPERGPMATSASPEEAGQHVQEQMAMNQQAGGEPEGDEAQAGAAPAPAAGGQAAPVQG